MTTASPVDTNNSTLTPADAPILDDQEMLFQEEPKQYNNNLTGSLFKNSQRTSEKHPNAKGRCEIDGQHYWIASWTKKAGTPEAFMSLAFTKLTPEEIIHYVK
jgi:hypothetical protein